MKELYGIVRVDEVISVFISSVLVIPINVKIIKSFLRKRDIQPITSLKSYLLTSLNLAVTWAWLEFISQSQWGQMTQSKFSRIKTIVLLLSLFLPSFILFSVTLFKDSPFKQKFAWGFELAITIDGLNLFVRIAVTCIILLFVFQMEFSHF
jgi:hypothetical protein